MALYTIIVEGPDFDGDNYSAFSPDVPGCVATGDTEEEAVQNMIDALAFHFEGLIEDGEPIPAPHTSAVTVPVPIAG